jgi:hypothetical protein
MISYCIAAYRLIYTRMLIADLVRKTTAPFEILVWDNTADPGFQEVVNDAFWAGWPVRVIGCTPCNIGMSAYGELFRAARFPLVVQIDDDVLCVSRGIAERAAGIFDTHRDVRQIVADVWQDDLTTGARPPLAHYRCVDASSGLYDGPVDGWFSIYHRSILPLLLSLPLAQYCCLGAMVRSRLAGRNQRGVLCTHMKVFHAVGPAYASLFGMLDFEVAKYRRLGRSEIVHWYQTERRPSRRALATRFRKIVSSLDAPAIVEETGP